MRQFLMAIFATMLPLAAAWADNVAKIGDKEYETLEAAFAAAQDGETITVLADCSGNGIKAPQGKFTTGLTVDFANHTYTVDGTTVGSTGTETNGFQLLKDNTITFKNGTITSEKALLLIQNYSNLTLKDMTLTLDNSSYASAYTLSNNNGNIAIDGTTINANPAGGFAFDVCRYASYPSVNVEVKGASVINGNVEIYASGSDAKDGFSLKLTSGELKGNIVVDPSAAAAMAKTPEKTVVTKSDTFKQDAPEGYKWQSDGNGNSTLVACEYVAQIGTVKYEKLAEAFAAAQDGETITLLADCTGDGIVAAQGKYKTNGLTVDFANHTYTVDGTTVGSTGTETNGFQLLKDNTITFKNGTITSEKALLLIQNYSNLTLKDMTLTLDNSSYASAYTLSNNNGNIAIDGTTITANTGGGFAFDVCRYSSYPSVNVEVKGESVIDGNVEIYASGSDAKDGFSLKLTSGELTGNIVVAASAAAAMEATPEKATVTKSDSFTQNAPEGYKWQSNEDGTSTLVACEYVAQIGSTKYETLEAAFAAAQDGQTITLLADCSGNGIIAAEGKYTQGLTVDFGNFTYTITGPGLAGSAGTKTQAFQLLKNNKITFQNGAIVGDNADVKMLIQNYSNLTLSNMVLDATKGTNNVKYVLSTNNGSTTISGTTITAKDGGFAFDACSGWGGYQSNSVEVTGESVINGNVEVSYYGQEGTQPASLALTSGKLDGDIVMAEGADKVTVTKSDSFTQDAPEGYKWQSNGDGTSTLVPLPVEEQDIVLKDGEAYTITTNTQVGSATYMRTFGAERVGKYQAWFVPFDHVITAEDAAAFKFYKINLIANANDPNSTTMDTEKVWIFLDEIAEGTTLYANRPYIFKPLAEQTDYKFITENAVLKAINTTSRLHNETSDNTYDFYGSYATNKVTDSSWMYYVDIYGKIGFSKSMTVGSYRWYIRTASKTGEENYARSIVFVDGSETSGITSARMESLPEGIYTLNGVKVERPVKGVYLVKKADGSIKKVSTK